MTMIIIQLLIEYSYVFMYLSQTYNKCVYQIINECYIYWFELQTPGVMRVRASVTNPKWIN